MAEEKVPEALEAKKDEDFSEWFHQLIHVADIIDQRYPAQGFLAYRPYGYEIHDRYIKTLENLLTEDNHKKVYFPVAIPEKLLSQEKDHIADFNEEVFWITHGGETEFGERLALRPTSETAMYTMLSLWVRSWRDLPVKIHQSTTVYRYETKHTRPLLRDREILWNEAHTSHETAEEAAKQVEKGVEIYRKLFDFIKVPTEFLEAVDVFPGAETAIEAFTMFPSGRFLEMGSVNNLGQRFSKAFDVKFKTRDGEEDYAYQTSYGVSERLLAAIIAIHGDDKGLVLPPELAPDQVVIVPIIFEDSKDDVLNKCEEVKKQLEEAGFRVKLDDSEKSAGEKFNIWELKGVPLRIEIGPRDLENNQAVGVHRIDGEKETFSQDNIVKHVEEDMKKISKQMTKKAEKYHDNMIKGASSIDEIKKLLEKGKAAKIPFCGNKDCAEDAEKKIENIEMVGHAGKAKGKCAICDKKAKSYGFIGKTY